MKHNLQVHVLFNLSGMVNIQRKNWALDNIYWKNDWVLIVDADERITSALALEIKKVIRTDTYDGFYINRRFMFMGDWIRHCGYYPSWNLRLFRHQLGRYEILTETADTGSGDNEIHEHVLVESKKCRIGYLRHDMLHYAYPSIDVWIEKHNRYSNWEARMSVSKRKKSIRVDTSPVGKLLSRKRWLKNRSAWMPCRPSLRFLYHYVYKQGFRDGYRGLLFCRLLAYYEFMSIAKTYEIQTVKKGNGCANK